MVRARRQDEEFRVRIGAAMANQGLSEPCPQRRLVEVKGLAAMEMTAWFVSGGAARVKLSHAVDFWKTSDLKLLKARRRDRWNGGPAFYVFRGNAARRA